MSTRNGEVSSARPPLALPLPQEVALLLQRVAVRLRSVADVDDRRLAELGLHIVDAGGKRLRPSLALSAAVAVGGPEAVDSRVVDAAVAIELVHLASLYHDDVLDSAALRRGRISANARWGNPTAILGGDVLLAHAFRVAAGLGPYALEALCETLVLLCGGQVAELDAQFDRGRRLADYDRSIRGKTAALIATSCRLGAAVAGGSPAAVEALSRYGAELGVAFQVIDDVLDLCAGSGLTGKPSGSDLREGVFTLPVLLALHDDPGLSDLLVVGIDDDGITEVRRRVHAVGADVRAAELGVGRVDAALAHLAAAELEPHGQRMLGAIAEATLRPLEQLPLGPRPEPTGSLSAVRRRRPPDATATARGDREPWWI